MTKINYTSLCLIYTEEIIQCLSVTAWFRRYTEGPKPCRSKTYIYSVDIVWNGWTINTRCTKLSKCHFMLLWNASQFLHSSFKRLPCGRHDQLWHNMKMQCYNSYIGFKIPQHIKSRTNRNTSSLCVIIEQGKQPHLSVESINVSIAAEKIDWFQTSLCTVNARAVENKSTHTHLMAYTN